MSLILTLIIFLVYGNKLVNHTTLVETAAYGTSQSKPICSITVHTSSDSVGYNLNSLLSLLNAHGRSTVSGKSKLYYDATLSHSMWNHTSSWTWTFDRFEIGSQENYLALAYYLEVQSLFAEYHGQSSRLYSKVKPSIRHIEQLDSWEPCKVDFLYKIGSAFQLTQERYPLLRRFFVGKNKMLPPSRLNQDVHYLVVHIRRGLRAMTYNIFEVLRSVCRLIRILNARYLGDLEIYIHTDGSTEFICKYLGDCCGEEKLTIFGRDDANVLQVISDMAHCDTLVGTPASLSYLGSYLTKAKHIFSGARLASQLMAPKTEDLGNYLHAVCDGHWRKCDGHELFQKSDQWLWDKGNSSARL